MKKYDIPELEREIVEILNLKETKGEEIVRKQTLAFRELNSTHMNNVLAGLKSDREFE